MKRAFRDGLREWLAHSDKGLWLLILGGVIVGVWLVGDYGMSWDEFLHQIYADQTMLSYVNKYDPLETISNLRFYGPFFPYLLNFQANISN
jgi:hypothetical protein